MRLRSCFLLSTLFVSAFPLAVPNEGNPGELHGPDEVLSVRDDADTKKQSPSVSSLGSSILDLTNDNNGNDGNIFTQQLPEEDEAQLLGKVPNTAGSSLIAFDDGIPGIGGAAEVSISAAVAAIVALLNRMHDVNQVFQDDSPNVKVKNFPFFEDPASPLDDKTTQPAPGATPGTGTAYRSFDIDVLCPSILFGTRKVAWSDQGSPFAIKIRIGVGITVTGDICTFSHH